MAVTELEKLCSPVFACICNYWQLNRITNLADRERFQRDITGFLGEAKKRAGEDPLLAQQYAWIEKPLVFFIDYMVKEGRFPFRQEWRELSRNYNELSGDEKFFDLLSETLEYPDMHNSFALFYVMLGLGFDGAYRFNHKHIEQCMRLCMERAALDYDIYTEPVIPPAKKKPFFARRRIFTIRAALIVCAVFMVLCFIVNLAVFIDTTEPYREVLKQTAADAAPPPKTLSGGDG
ncbi:MAG: DotU family type IV/VI secretion system protein [Treponema sp.]|jgi:type VI protein secretion system component VasF|nr:DotU family type IV/VI secretion system protein [Treponema sp.]